MTSLDSIAKRIADLDNLLQLLCKSVRTSTPWELKLHDLLTQADQQMLLARLCVSMEGKSVELNDAVGAICDHLRAAELSISKGRCEAPTRVAVKIANGLARSIRESLASAGDC
ncbi:hypothetical protein [Paucibacter sp. DJ2R-2]|uniref:hypothetical protein n=1 Tax=Paucibacter sp. DJ2R-2 TaxID=2893558 RepID=UPI0021E402C5|nr:hypothetical protein [Paucibacter sp. DJ2R-2]MCV2438596.1 hypothetical protein [Paucibacter sp. DJ2R-2]